MPRVAVIIPVLNNWELTHDCLEHLAAHTSGAEDVEFIVVDNGSCDATQEACPTRGRTLFGERFSYLRFEHNLNFGPACNAAVWQSTADMVFLLNNDTQVGSGWLPPLLAGLEQPNVVGVGPLLTYPEGDVQHLGIAFWPGGKGVAHLYRNLAATHPLATKQRRFQALTAAALLLRRQDFVAAEGFDEGYVNGFEDVDLGLRLTKGECFMTCIPESRVVHLESRTPTRKAHEAHNAARLAAAWPLAQYGDLPELADADGYCLRVGPDLDLAFELPPERELAMMRRLGLFDPVRCYDLLQEEPFWTRGYGLLCAFLEQQGLYEEAATLCVQQFRLLLAPVPEEYERLSRVLRAAGLSFQGAEAGMAQQRVQICSPDYALRFETCLSALRAANKPLHAALIPRFFEAAAEAERLREAWK